VIIKYILILWLLLQVPFIDQNAPEWWLANDCGPATAQMVIQFYTGETFHPHTYYNETGAKKSDVQASSDIARWMGTKGVPSTVQHNWTIEQLREAFAESIPVITIIETPLGGHFVLMVGLTKNRIFIHDPSEGPNQSIPLDEFETMWEYPSSWRDNRVIVPNEAP